MLRAGATITAHRFEQTRYLAIRLFDELSVITYGKSRRCASRFVRFAFFPDRQCNTVGLNLCSATRSFLWFSVQSRGVLNTGWFIISTPRGGIRPVSNSGGHTNAELHDSAASPTKRCCRKTCCSLSVWASTIRTGRIESVPFADIQAACSAAIKHLNSDFAILAADMVSHKSTTCYAKNRRGKAQLSSWTITK